MSPNSLPASGSERERIRWRILASLKDLISFALAGLLAFELRFDGTLPAKYHHPFVIALIVWAIAKTMAFAVGAVNRGYWRYTSIYDAQRIALANSAGSVLGVAALISLLGPVGEFPALSTSSSGSSPLSFSLAGDLSVARWLPPRVPVGQTAKVLEPSSTAPVPRDCSYCGKSAKTAH